MSSAEVGALAASVGNLVCFKSFAMFAKITPLPRGEGDVKVTTKLTTASWGPPPFCGNMQKSMECTMIPPLARARVVSVARGDGAAEINLADETPIRAFASKSEFRGDPADDEFGVALRSDFGMVGLGHFSQIRTDSQMLGQGDVRARRLYTEGPPGRITSRSSLVREKERFWRDE